MGTYSVMGFSVGTYEVMKFSVGTDGVTLFSVGTDEVMVLSAVTYVVSDVVTDEYARFFSKVLTRFLVVFNLSTEETFHPI